MSIRNLATSCLLVITLLMWGCKQASSRSKQIVHYKRACQSKLELLKKNKRHLDIITADTNLLTVIVKISTSSKLILVRNGNYPDSVEVTYNVYKDSSGKILYTVEMPYSESGDWFIAYKSYFDKSGNLFAFVKETNSFNSECTEGVAHEKLTEYFDKNSKVIDTVYSLVDNNNKPLNRSSCVFNYEFPHVIIHSIAEFKTINNIH